MVALTWAATGLLRLDPLVAAGVGTVLRHPVGAAGTLLLTYGTGQPLILPHLPDIVLGVPFWGWTAMIVLVAGAVFSHREA